MHRVKCRLCHVVFSISLIIIIILIFIASKKTCFSQDINSVEDLHSGGACEYVLVGLKHDRKPR